ncbi:MAG TPA: hypothetical protein GXX18_18770 [Bacillales bacterium]|nr:hypothetical protein [Bacillales bacterium]
MKVFISTFLACIVICWLATVFFVSFILNNIWAIIIFIAFLLAVLITVLVKQAFRLEELEKNVEKLLNNKQD